MKKICFMQQKDRPKGRSFHFKSILGEKVCHSNDYNENDCNDGGDSRKELAFCGCATLTEVRRAGATGNSAGKTTFCFILKHDYNNEEKRCQKQNTTNNDFKSCHI